jgi:hypothetical protein
MRFLRWLMRLFRREPEWLPKPWDDPRAKSFREGSAPRSRS